MQTNACRLEWRSNHLILDRFDKHICDMQIFDGAMQTPKSIWIKMPANNEHEHRHCTCVEYFNWLRAKMGKIHQQHEMQRLNAAICFP